MLIPLLRHLGPRWLAQRARFALAKKSGWLASQSPCLPWSSFGPQGDRAAFVKTWQAQSPVLPHYHLNRVTMRAWLAQHASKHDFAVVAEAQALVRGQLKIFSGKDVAVGNPPLWFKNVLTGEAHEATSHWSKINDRVGADIKGVWEPSRFSWALTLARAWLHTGEEVDAQTFWDWTEDWMAKNPPNVGPNWMCGQEASLRLIAFTWALQVFRDHPQARLTLAAQLADATAQRVESHLDYALSQSNNHGISEAIGLLTVGTFWPNLPRASHWRQRGLETLAQQTSALIAEDGSFSQHSSNYHRLLVQLLTWAELTQQARGETLPPEIKKSAQAATLFLNNLVLQDGTVPRYGGDDGANLFPLADSPYADFRPALAPALYLFHQTWLPAGAWSEACFLLLGKSEEGVLKVPDEFSAGGCTLYRSTNQALFFRHPTEFRHRPAHADHLHVALRYQGAWLTEDLGTYSYNAKLSSGKGWSAARFHNVVTINERDPMRRVGRFLWLPWTVCHPYAVPVATGKTAAYYDGLEGGRVARAVINLSEGFVIVDRVTHSTPVSATLRWHGRDQARLHTLQVFCSTAAQESWLSADKNSDLGWYSEFYGTREASWVHALKAEGKTIFFLTVVTPEAVSVDWQRGTFKIGSVVYNLNANPDSSPV